jgi:transcriptional regulator with XRE-family HTH domain
LSTRNSTPKETRNATSINATFFVAMNINSTTVLDKLWQSVGRKIRERRDELGLTQEAAGKRAKMKRQQWNRIEQGASTKRPTLLRIAKALELKPEIVLDWAGFKLNGVRTDANTVEEALDSALFFDQKGLSEEDLETIRPLLEGVDRVIDRLSKSPATPQDDDIRQTYEEFEREIGGPPVREIPDDQPKGGLMNDHLRPTPPKRGKKPSRRDTG